MCAHVPLALQRGLVSAVRRPTERLLALFVAQPLPQALAGHKGWPEQWRHPEPKPSLRRRHHRRRRPWPGDRLLPRQGARRRQHRRAGKGLARRRQYRAQYDGRALQLSLGSVRGHLRPRPPDVGDAVGRAELQRDVLAARLSDARPQPARGAEFQAPPLRQPARRHSERMGDARAGEGGLPDPQHLPARRVIPMLGGVLQRRGGTARHDAVAWGYARAASARGVDILQNCEVKAILRDAAGAVSGVETYARDHRDEEARRRRRRSAPAT